MHAYGSVSPVPTPQLGLRSGSTTAVSCLKPSLLNPHTHRHVDTHGHTIRQTHARTYKMQVDVSRTPVSENNILLSPTVKLDAMSFRLARMHGCAVKPVCAALRCELSAVRTACTWGSSDDVYTLLQGPAGLLGVGAPNQQLTPQLGLGEVLLEAVHEVVGLLC